MMVVGECVPSDVTILSRETEGSEREREREDVRPRENKIKKNSRAL